MDSENITLKKILITIVIAICVVMFIAYLKSTPVEPLSKEAQRRQLIEKKFDSWDGSHRNLVIYIKENMNDPDSYKHVKTTFYDNGQYLLVQTSFRGKNAFGGVVLNHVRAKVGIDGSIIEILDIN